MSANAPPKTFITDLRPGRYVSIETTVVQLDPAREIEQGDGVKRKVRDGVLKDGTSEIALPLWGDEVERVGEGETIRIIDGWVKAYRGKPEISLGRRGRVEKA